MTLISVSDQPACSRPSVPGRLTGQLSQQQAQHQHQQRHQQRHSQRGFTLLELLLVLGILGMAAMLLGPGLATLDSPGFNAQTREATGLLNYARRMAVVQGTPAAIEFRAAADTSDNAGDDNDGQQADIVGRWVGDNIALSYRDSAGQDVSVDKPVLVTFYPEGGSTGGELIMQQDNRLLTISVDPFSGRVRVLDEE